jgi:hypothetical protein
MTFRGTFTSLFKDKKSKRSHKQQRVETNVFLTIFYLMIEGSEFGSRRSKNMWIR